MLMDKKEIARKNFLKKRKLHIVEKISKGYSSEVFLVKNKAGKKFALKIEKQNSPRKNLVQKEVKNLGLANSEKIGPKLVGFDETAGIVLMELIVGPTFNEWLFERKPSKKQMSKFIKNLLLQAKKLDEIGLDHGQLAGRGKNILVRYGLPVIIDFEKGSQVRKCRNENQLKSFLFENPHSEITKKIKIVLSS